MTAIPNQVLASSSNVFVDTRAALQALDPTTVTNAYLTEVGREGQWIVRSGTAPVSDPAQGVYVISSTAGYYWQRIFDGLAVNSGWFGGDWQAAIDFAGAASIPTVNASGTITLTAGTGSLKMRPGVTVYNFAGTATVMQANGANINHIVDFTAYAANGARLIGIVVDGNWANNTKTIGNSNSLALIYDQNDITIQNCTLRNGTGNGVIIRAGLRYNIDNNVIDSVFIQGITAVSNNPNFQVRGVISRNKISNHGQIAIVVGYSTFVKVRDNIVQSSLVRTGLNVTKAAGSNVVTSNSGPFFTPDMAGRFIVIGGGTEYLITAVTSTTTLTVNLTTGSFSIQPAAIGQGDNISLQGCNYCDVEDNYSFSGATLGISVFCDATYGGYGVRVSRNTCVNNGSAGLSIQVASGSNSQLDTIFSDNLVVDPGQSNTAGAAVANVGLYVQGAALIDGIVADSNRFRSFTGFMAYGISYGAGATNKVTGNNLYRGYTTAPVNNP
ncbi:hypothetical protein GA0061102_107124 [Rhizobium miluonense]|uniref:Right handed beta helix domain-containing protein n=2 Tax=Rhizobium miluonense TaxID=411945 RepID=A0A1C3XAH5_9HYPH|nr:hypothetical protein GA0061102_107124 [Rhizobium miluonense]